VRTVNVHWSDKQKSGWHEKQWDYNNFIDYDIADHYTNIVDWIQQNVECPERHARWKIDSYGIYFRFRYERDYLNFLLRWA
jgi:hypothetical protein